MPKKPTQKPIKYILDADKLDQLKDQIQIVLADYQSMRADPCPQCHEMARYRPDSKVDDELPAQCPKCGYRFVGFSQGQGLRNEVSNRILSNLKLIAATIVVALALVGCVADEIVLGDDQATPDGGLEPDAELADVDAQAPQTCDPVGLYETTFIPDGSGNCGVDDIGRLDFKVIAREDGSWYIDGGTTPLIDGTVFDVDGKCQIDVYRTAPYGQSVMQIHATMREDDDGDGVAIGIGTMGLYNFMSGFTCVQSYTAAAAVF